MMRRGVERRVAYDDRRTNRKTMGDGSGIPMERTVWALLLWAMARRVTVEPGDAREIFIQRGGQLCGRWARWADGWNEAGISGVLISLFWSSWLLN